MTKPFDPTKPVQTRDGRPARIICTDKKAERPIIALVDEDGGEDDHHYYPDGRVYKDFASGNDLINIPQKVTKYGLMNRTDGVLFGIMYDDEGAATADAGSSYRVVTITWEE